MKGQISSLNASVATAIVMYELFDKEGSTPCVRYQVHLSTHPVGQVFNLRLVSRINTGVIIMLKFPVVSAKYYPGSEMASGEYFEPRKKGKAPLAF